MAEVRRSMKAGEAEEVFWGPRLAAWLPEAEWEWHDRVHSNLWPCELPSRRGGRPTSPMLSDLQWQETQD